MPLVWPERFPSPRPDGDARRDLRERARAAAPRFAIAAGRLAFCGGFDLEDPDILAEAAAAAGLDVDGALLASRDPRRDHQIDMAGRAVGHAGGTTLPALEHERRLYCGEAHITAWLSQAAGAIARPSASLARRAASLSVSSSAGWHPAAPLSQSLLGWTEHCDTCIAGSAGDTR